MLLHSLIIFVRRWKYFCTSAGRKMERAIDSRYLAAVKRPGAGAVVLWRYGIKCWSRILSSAFNKKNKHKYFTFKYFCFPVMFHPRCGATLNFTKWVKLKETQSFEKRIIFTNNKTTQRWTLQLFVCMFVSNSKLNEVRDTRMETEL